MGEFASFQGTSWRVRLVSKSAAATARLGRALGRALRGGEVLALVGPLGSGKTTLARGVAAGLGVSGRVRSPSFTLVSRLGGRLPLFHMDLYRLEGAVNLEELGWGEADDGRAVAIVEWAEKAVLDAPERTVRVLVSYATPGRVIEIEGEGSTAHVRAGLAKYHDRSL
jgi:tRNA threonylcarbamoyladenosine biosynthesis protein TsaE